MFSVSSIFFWIIVCVLVGMLANSKNRSFFAYFLISLILSPIIGLLIVLIVGQKENKNSKVKKVNFNNIEENTKCRRIDRSFENNIYRIVINNYNNEDFRELKQSVINQYKNYSKITRNEETFWSTKNIHREDTYIQIKQKGNSIILEAYNVSSEPIFEEETIPSIEKKEIIKFLKDETYFVKIKNYEDSDFKVFKESLLSQYKEKGYTNIIRDKESLWNVKNTNYLNSYIQLKLKNNELILEAYNVPFEPGVPEEMIPKEEDKETIDSSEKLIQLSKLVEKGLLTEEEFISEKKKILNIS